MHQLFDTLLEGTDRQNMNRMQSYTLIAGIGSPHGDDQAGWRVAERLASECDSAQLTVCSVKSPVALLDWLDGIRRLIICDACQGLGRIGEVRRWVWPDCELASVAWSGTHDLPLPAVLQLADRLGRLPQSVVIWSVEGAESETLTPLSAEVAAALPKLVADITKEVHQDQPCTNIHS